MAYQTIFERYEYKYLITRAQKESILKAMEPYMQPDEYGPTTIRNIYYDTEDYRLIRRSLERPVYKEKLRLRSYAQASPESTVFAELKKKYKSVVYKRRLALPEAAARALLAGEVSGVPDSQIHREIDYFLSYYQTLRPVLYLSYQREAYCQKGGDLRVTFDEQILCRRQALSLQAGTGGTPILPKGQVLMEIKCSGGIPLWMTHALSAERLYKTSFSKYGTAYETIIFPASKEEIIDA